MAVFPDEPGSTSSSLDPPSTPERNLWRLVEQDFLQAGCLFCHPTINVKALKGTRSTNLKGKVSSTMTYIFNPPVRFSISLENFLYFVRLFVLCRQGSSLLWTPAVRPYNGPVRLPRKRKGIGSCVRCVLAMCRVKEGLSRSEQLVFL